MTEKGDSYEESIETYLTNYIISSVMFRSMSDACICVRRRR